MTDEQQSPRFKTYQNQHMVESVKKIYLDENKADVHFSFSSNDGSVTRVPAHKILLAAGSDVFEAMFYGGLKENGDVNIVDVSDAAFMEFIQYFYLGDVKLTEENIVGVINLGHKYNVKKCIEDGFSFLMDILNEGNVCDALQLAILYDRQELIKSCETLIIINTAEVFKSNDFLDCDEGVLEHILKMNVMSCSEVDVFEACMAWIRAKSGENILSKELVDTHMGQLYYEIRFKSIDMQEFCLLSNKYDSVLRCDCSTLMQMIGLPEFQSGRFNKHPRLNCYEF